MKVTVALFTALILATTSAFAGPTGGSGRKPVDPKVTAGKGAKMEVDTNLKSALESAKLDSAIAEKYAEAGVKLSAETVRKINDRLTSEQSAALGKIMTASLSTVTNAKSLGDAISTNGKAIADSANTMATKVIETLLNDKSGAVDLVKMEQVAQLLSVSKDTLANDGASQLKIVEVESALGAGRKIKDLKDCF